MRVLERRSIGWAGCLAWLLISCATPRPEGGWGADGAALPTRAEVAGVPFHPQADFHCGPAALAMMAGWSGLPLAPDDLAGQVFTPARRGSFRSDMIGAARRHGLLAVPIRSVEAIHREIAAGHPVLVFQNLGLRWVPRWHYAVAIGYDRADDVFLLRSGPVARLRMDRSLFERTWIRGGEWAIAVLPPARLPATATEREVLEAAIGLERAGRLADATQAYEAILARWPRSTTAHVGLGNARHALRDDVGAERAYRAAIALDSEASDAWNNLAYALAGQQRRAEARSAARRAVELGGPRVEIHRDTLRELSSEPAREIPSEQRTGWSQPPRQE